MNHKTLTRRAFLAAATTGSLLLTGVPVRANTARVIPRKLSPNEKINVAGIGVGGKGTGDILSCRRENVVALCDPDKKRAAEAFFRLPKATQYADYRQMFDDMADDIDACTISTPDHSHAPAAYLAMNLGKHVFVQKPLTHTVAEARLLTRLAAEKDLVTQMGNQGHCEDGVRDLCEMLWDGAIGTVTEVHVWTNRPVWKQGMTEALAEEAVPGNLDWDLWTGPAPLRPYNRGYAPFHWRGWWDFGCGAIGDMACHIMDPAFWSLKLYEAENYSVEVLHQDGFTSQSPPLNSIIKYEFPQRGDLAPVSLFWYDGNNMPPYPESLPKGQKLGDGKNGSLFIGTKGLVTAGEYGGKSRLLPDKIMKDYKAPDPYLPRIPKGNPQQNWLDCIRENKKAASDFSYAGPLTEMANMGNVALLAGGARLEMDVKTLRITNNEEANTLLTKEYRKGWELPC
jgi:predicted dehydrogenase